MSIAVRIPKETHSSTRAAAALRGKTPGEMIAEAWDEYLANHRDEFSSDLEKAAQLVKAGDFDGLAKHASRDAESRAAQAVARRNRS